MSIPHEVRIGGVSRSDLLESIRGCGVQLNPWALALLEDRRFATLDREQVIQIVARSVADLGLAEGGTYEQVLTRALESGLSECPLEAAAHLRMQYLDQPDGDAGTPAAQGGAPSGSITVASAPLDDGDEAPKGFYLRCIDGVLWLRGYRASSDHVWAPAAVFVFSSGRLPE